MGVVWWRGGNAGDLCHSLWLLSLQRYTFLDEFPNFMPIFLGNYYIISCSLFVYKVTSSIMFYSITACLSPCYPYHSVPVTLLPRRSCPRVYTLSGKDTTLFIMDNRCNDFYLFHECKDTKKKRKYSHIFREKTCNFQIKT